MATLDDVTALLRTVWNYRSVGGNCTLCKWYTLVTGSTPVCGLFGATIAWRDLAWRANAELTCDRWTALSGPAPTPLPTFSSGPDKRAAVNALRAYVRVRPVEFSCALCRYAALREAVWWCGARGHDDPGLDLAFPTGGGGTTCDVFRRPVQPVKALPPAGRAL